MAKGMLSAHEIAKDVAEAKLTDFRAALQQVRAAESAKIQFEASSTRPEAMDPKAQR